MNLSAIRHLMTPPKINVQPKKEHISEDMRISLECRREKALVIIEELGCISTYELQVELNVSNWTARADIHALAEEGLIVKFYSISKGLSAKRIQS